MSWTSLARQNVEVDDSRASVLSIGSGISDLGHVILMEQQHTGMPWQPPHSRLSSVHPQKSYRFPYNL